MADEQVDAIVIGGGPAGSTAASVLAMHGRKVILLEKEKFPRYHIGESLLPYGYFTMKRIGVVEKMKSSHFTKKYSVQFVSMRGKQSQPFYFFQHLEHEAAQTWQVLRGEFDQMLLDNAREKGADVREESRVKEILWDGDRAVGVRVAPTNGEEYTVHAPITIDASGRDALTIARNGWRVMDEKLKKVAVWTYYKGAMRDEGYDEGATTIAYVPEKGWFWYIPLHENLVSVGVVADKEYLFSDTRELSEIFYREVAKNQWLTDHLAVGEQTGRFYTTGEYSYRSKYCAADGIILAGDAFAFLDPVFSSGVFLALRSGEMAADEAHRALEDGDVSAARFEEYGRQLCKGIESMRNLVYAFYDLDFSFRTLMNEHPHLHGDLTDCLIGNLWKDFEPLFSAVGEFADLPKPLSHGLPKVPECVLSS
jgi:flavin-dependent dehydrogenase